MKANTAALLTMILLGSLCGSVTAQQACSLTVRNRSGVSVGNIESDGDIRDAGGRYLGRFQDGAVRDRSGVLIGRVDSSGNIRDRSGVSIGKIENDGDLRDRSGVYIGKIEQDGDVRNRSGAQQGRLQGYSSSCRFAAAAYLFLFKPLHLQ